MANDRAPRSKVGEHRHRDLAGECARGLVMGVLRRHDRRRAAAALDRRFEGGERRADRDIDPVDLGRGGQERIEERARVGARLVHLPVRREQRRPPGSHGLPAAC